MSINVKQEPVSILTEEPVPILTLSPTSPSFSETSLSSCSKSVYEESASPCWDSNIVFATPRAFSYPPPTPSRRVFNYNPSPVEESTSKSGQNVVCVQTGCGRQFKSRSHLMRHERMHTGEKPFGCPYQSCIKRFSRRDNMVQHHSTHKIA
jgi:uncharacterized Zn-finger protein